MDLVVLDNGHSRDLCAVVKTLHKVCAVAVVDLNNNGENTGNYLLNKVNVPLLQSLGKNGVVCIGKGIGNDMPSLSPAVAAVVQQNSHQLGDSEGGMGVVDVDSNLFVEVVESAVKPGEKVPDGDGAMKTVFSANTPLIEFCNRSTDSGANTQKGFMEMLAGAMSALRNPKAHANIQIDRNDAMRRLIFASMLMYKIDEAVNYSKIAETSSMQ